MGICCNCWDTGGSCMCCSCEGICCCIRTCSMGGTPVGCASTVATGCGKVVLRLMPASMTLAGATCFPPFLSEERFCVSVCLGEDRVVSLLGDLLGETACACGIVLVDRVGLLGRFIGCSSSWCCLRSGTFSIT